MLHACSYTICLVFCYTSWRFNAFSGTNLLTRCHSASSLFSAVFVFQKSYTGNILRIGWNKSWTSYFYRSFAKTEDEMEGARGWPHHRGVRPSPWPRPPMVSPPGPPPNEAPSPIKTPRRENLRDRSLFLETYCKPPPSSNRDREDPGALPGTLSERGIPAGVLLHHHGRLQSDVWVVYLGLRVHSSS
jgi:hypothetical protein